MRITVAAVLIPLAVAIAYAGGWLWTALVTLAAIGLFVEWLAIVGLAGATRVTVPGVAEALPVPAPAKGQGPSSSQSNPEGARLRSKLARGHTATPVTGTTDAGCF